MNEADCVKEQTLVDGFQAYADAALKTSIYDHSEYDILYPVLGLCSEAGEVADKVKKALRDNGGIFTLPMKHEIAKELGDCLWYIAATARDLGVPFGIIPLANLAKLESRKERGVLHGSGDNR